PEFENKETVELLNAETNELGFPVIISGVLDLITFKAFGGDGLISDLKWGGSRTANTPNAMHQKGELRFCLYPAMHEVSSGEYLPFRYFRLNIFEQFAIPNFKRSGRSIFGMQILFIYTTLPSFARFNSTAHPNGGS